jgi:hypothetical protein
MASSINASTTAGVVTTADTSGVLNIQTAGTTAITIDASQNVGQNGAASAWAGAGRYVYQINDTVVGYFSAKTRGEFTCNYYYNGSVDSYIQNGYSGLYLIDSTTGNHTWFTAPNNTSGAGATMTTTQAMTLDASGNLLVGSTSTRGSAKLDIRSDTSIALGSNASFYGTIGYSAGAGLLSLAAESGGGINFLSGATERARIDSSGNLLVGATSSPAGATKIYAKGANGNQLRLDNAGENYTQIYFANNGTDKADIYFENSSTRFHVRCNSSGGVYLSSGATSWTAVSDERKKDIIEPITDAVVKVSTLRAVIGKYKTDAEGIRRSFLIAQDIQAVLPEAVDANDPDDLGVQYSDVIPLLVAAIKEQSALITQLQADVAALKGA